MERGPAQEKFDVLERIIHIAQKAKSEPGRSISGVWATVFGEGASHDIYLDVDVNYIYDLLEGFIGTESGIAAPPSLWIN